MCANDFLLTTVMREKWGYQGYVTSDSGAIDDIYQQHLYVQNATAAVGAAYSAGRFSTFP